MSPRNDRIHRQQSRERNTGKHQASCTLRALVGFFLVSLSPLQAATHGHEASKQVRLASAGTVTIGNGPDSPDGSYLNAGNMADTLVFTTVEVIASAGINVADDIDMASGP